MRLTRRRRRSLHDLDVGHASYEDFTTNVPNRDDAVNDWIQAILSDRGRDERIRRQRARVLGIADNQTARAAMGPDLQAQPAPRRVASPVFRDVLQMTRRISDRSQLTWSVDAQRGLTLAQQALTQQMRAYVTRTYPGTVRDWEYAFDVQRDSFNQETVITITARRR